MMSKIRILQVLLLAAMVSGCSKEDPAAPSDIEDSSSISFTTEALWTRGSNIGSIADVDALDVYSYYINDKDWKDVDADDLNPYFTDDTNTPFVLNVADDGTSTYEGGKRYWPAVDGVQLSFYTFYPTIDNFVQTLDPTSGRPTYKYTSSEQAQENHDLVYSAKCDLTIAKNNNSPQVTFDLKHLLSKLSLKAKTIGTCSDDATYEQGSVSYTIEGLVISGLYSKADIEVGVDEGLQLDQTAQTIDMTASQGNTLKGCDDSGAELYLNPNASGSDGYTDIMSDGKAIFVLAQGIGTTARPTNAPTIKLRIRKEFKIKGTEEPSSLIYQTKDITIPAANSVNSWQSGKHYGLLFDFDLSKLDEYDTPLTVKSEVYDWDQASVEVDATADSYMYLSSTNVSVPQHLDYAEMFFMTNYKNDLRTYSRKKGADGTLADARGFSFYAVDNTPSNPTSWNETGAATYPVMLWKDDNTFNSGKDYDYTTLQELPLDFDMTDLAPYTDAEGYMYFVLKMEDGNKIYYKAKKTTRKEMEMHTNTSQEGPNGLNRQDDDAVYILRFDMSSCPLQHDGLSGYLYGKLGAEMLSNGSGVISNKFRITINKAL